MYVSLKDTADNDRAKGKGSVAFNQNPVRAVQPRRSKWPILDINEGNEENRGECIYISADPCGHSA